MTKSNVFKFSWFAAILASLIPVTWELIWTIYNTYVPIYLQGGNAAFEAGMGAAVVGFGMGPALTGFIMTFDNIASLFIVPFVAAWSDSLRTRWGRRKPFFLVGMPLILVGFIGIPIIAGNIPAELSGQLSELTSYFVPFLVAIFLVLVPIALVKAPSNTLLFDVTPSEHRGTVYGIANAIAGFLAIFVGITGSALYAMNMNLPFIIIGGFSLLCVIMVWIFVKEPQIYEKTEDSPKVSENIKKILASFKTLPAEHAKSLILLFVVELLAFIFTSLTQAFGSSFGLTVLKMNTSNVIFLPVTYAVAVAIFAIPVAILGDKFGRRKTRIIGLVVMIVTAILCTFVRNIPFFIVLVGISGVGWAANNVNAAPMFMDCAPSDDVLATYGAIQNIAVTLGLIIGPIVGGGVVQAFGGNYNVIWPMMAVVALAAIFVMLPVTRGEPKRNTAPVG